MLTYDIPKVIRMLEENQEALSRDIHDFSNARNKAATAWRVALVKFAREALKPSGILRDDESFKKVVMNPDLSWGCLDRLNYPKLKEFFPEETLGHKRARLSTIRSRIRALKAYPDGKKLRMSEERFSRYVEGREV